MRSMWTDPRDPDARFVVLCAACAREGRSLLQDVGFGVIAGECLECRAVFCACRGEAGCKGCPLPKAKTKVDRLRVYRQQT